VLRRGYKYEYKYIVEDNWMYDNNVAKVEDGKGGFNNLIE
jgi:hypothetical protein